MGIDFDKLKVQGVKVNYFYICKRKLWLFSKGISMEQNSDRVLYGKLVHKNAYPRLKKREVLIDDILKLDIMDKTYVKEIKVSSKMTEADKMQLLYYLYYLKQLGIEKKGMINYVKERKLEEISLTAEYEKKIENTLVEINRILKMETPPALKKLPYCKKCAYYEFCYALEED
ncbi:CRISPR-associated protein Cas4 [Caldisalinibacter kiritimatiensis]|uniref:CRISPR-associated exonuclease Cas4 n=1 Tax=Caldisalinibacter kiritimatiensis TaxID=1304284 RepID=R1CZ18_9FIRM|nr:CRISPR-associated protein Cas4 [Caldisalinibacter kiritimatiensis]EOD01824.1 CRISPR-associated RecB family exonuclease Cas4a [Caldisalinibacter kiritimatiensis]